MSFSCVWPRYKWGSILNVTIIITWNECSSWFLGLPQGRQPRFCFLMINIVRKNIYELYTFDNNEYKMHGDIITWEMNWKGSVRTYNTSREVKSRDLWNRTQRSSLVCFSTLVSVTYNPTPLVCFQMNMLFTSGLSETFEG